MSKPQTLLLTLILVPVLAVTMALAKTTEKPSRIVLMIDHDTHGFIYSIDGTKVSEFLTPMSERHQRTGPEPEVILLVHDRATFETLNSTLGILSKAGYSARPRIFVFGRYKHSMNELNYTYSPQIPFSATGEVASRN
jgi:hypothetical protein